jgi:RNA polymerase sigma factor (sigma-70 family)
MPHPALSASIARVGRAVDTGADHAPTDGRLLTRYACTRDEAAFTELVRRLGPMVLGVCRRVTGDDHHADDAFQAAFVVLARRAGDVRPAESVRGWMYGVAVRTARGARSMSARHRTHEKLVPTPPDRPARTSHSPDADALQILDEEIAALPDHLRTAVVLCELDGVSRNDAATRLGIPEGTLSSRLGKARKTLAHRVRKRGIVLSTAGLSAVLGQVASAAVPADLIVQTVAAAISPGTISAPVATLSNGVLRLMIAHKLKSVSVALGLAATVICGSLLLASDPPTPDTVPRPLIAFADPPKPAITPGTRAADPKPLPKGPNKILFYRSGHLTLIDPDGKNDTKVSEDRGQFLPGTAKLSPDGKRLAVLLQAEPTPAPVGGIGVAPRRKLYVRELTAPEPGTDLGVYCQMFFWSPDGTEIAYCDYVEGPEKASDVTHGIVKVATKETTSLKIPEGHIFSDWSRDGKSFLTTNSNNDRTNPTARVYQINRDGTGEKALTPADQLAAFGQLSPDGKRVLYTTVILPTKDKPGPSRMEPTVIDLTTGKVTPVANVPLNAEVQGFCWSPDGKQIAYAWREVHEGKPEELVMKETESYLVVCDPDGKNPKTIASEKGSGQWIITISNVDWR